MEQVDIIGIDLAKRSFQLHGARADGSVAFRRKVSREKLLYFLAALPRCVVAMEACASAHHWGREIMRLGHDVRLVPPIYVKPFVKRQKNDAADAEAICEAAQRPTMRFVAVKGEEQQARAMLFHTRDLLVRLRAPGRRRGTADDDTGDWADQRDGAPGLRAADGELSARPRLLCLVGPRAATAHDRRQAKAGQDIEDGPTRSEAPLDHRRHGCRQLGGSSRRNERPLAGQDAGAQAANACRGGAGQQDGAHRLGAHDTQGDLPRFRAGCCLTRRQPRGMTSGIVIRQDGEVVAEHPRSFGRGRIVYDPWHYVPILTKKPGALRNGAPFKGWQLPNALGRLRTRLSARDDGDRQFVKVLAAVLEDGLEAVEAACAEALDSGACSADVVLNILARQCQPAPPASIPTPEGLVADCQRYDRLRGAGHGAS